MKNLTIMEQNRVELAKEYCKFYHKGQFRKASNEPFWTHPFEVARILESYGYADPITQSIAYLHDIIEDTDIEPEELKSVFGFEVYNGIYVLSRNKGKNIDGTELNEEQYKQRILYAPKRVHRIKIADLIHNTRTLSVHSENGINTKIRDIEEFYVPLGNGSARIMVRELIENIQNYRVKAAS